MQQLEKLNNLIPEVPIIFDTRMPNGIGGLYVDKHIYLNANYNYYFNVAHLAEEIGHHETSYGDVTRAYGWAYNVNAARQELRARRFGHKLILPLEKLIKCYELGIWDDIYAICLHLEIDRSHFATIIEDYKNQFGLWVKYRGYIITFEPLQIKKITPSKR